MDFIPLAILIGATLLIVCVLSSQLAFRLGAPLLLVFLGLGLLAGEDGLGIVFDDIQAAYLIGSVALAVILFESGFETPMRSYRIAAWPAIAAATLGVIITAGLVGMAARWLLDLNWLEALLIGAVVGSTDAAAVFFLLRTGGITMRERVRSTLEIESGSNDPMAIFLTVALVELIAAGATEVTWHVGLTFAQQMGVGAVVGIAGGLLIPFASNRLDMEPGLYAVFSLASALLIFGAASVLDGSGFLAVYIAGLIAGNSRLRGTTTLKRFHDGITWLAQIVMFLTLGLLATPTQFPAVLGPAAILGAVLIFIARPVAIWLCLLPFRFSRNEITFVAWVGLRGAVSILLAIVPALGGLAIAPMVFDVVFLIVLMSLVIQGWTIRPTARWLGLIVPRHAGPDNRMEIELPGQAVYELVAYTIAEDSPVIRGRRLPRWARPSLIVRGDKVLSVHTARGLRVGDQVYLFSTPSQVPLLDKLFSPSPEITEDDREFFGDLVLKPSVTIGALAETYGLPLSLDQKNLTLKDLFEQEFPKPEIGDRLRIGSVEVVARTVDDTGITSVGLFLEPTPLSRPRLMLFQSPAELWLAIRRAGARLRHHLGKLLRRRVRVHPDKKSLPPASTPRLGSGPKPPGETDAAARAGTDKPVRPDDR
ncbi:MAG: potassium/proton antiporter [Rhodospirillales bacterium]|nr:MAG: potassium/proton antiporter [Rhodospirillales bacterium]